MNRGLGWLPERRLRAAKDRVGATARRLVGDVLIRPRPGHRYALKRDLWVLDQSTDPSCTGHNTAEVIYGLTGEKTSPEMLWIYGLLHDGEHLGSMTRRGLPVSSVLRAAREHGSCRFESWNRRHPEYAFGRLPPGLLRAEAQQFNLKAQVLGTKIATRDGLVDGILRNRPGGIVVEVDAAFDDAKSNVIGPRSGPSRGRHIITPWAVECLLSGEIVLECVNSWGTDHGDGGIVRLSEERVLEAPYAYVGMEVD
jgi:hypothetical protein